VRWADETTTSPLVTVEPLGRRTVATLALVAGIGLGYLASLPASEHPTIGSQTVPAIACTEDEIIALMPGVVEPLCVHADAFTDAAID
jgi:hypothetical protein